MSITNCPYPGTSCIGTTEAISTNTKNIMIDCITLDTRERVCTGYKVGCVLGQNSKFPSESSPHLYYVIRYSCYISIPSDATRAFVSLNVWWNPWWSFELDNGVRSTCSQCTLGTKAWQSVAVIPLDGSLCHSILGGSPPWYCTPTVTRERVVTNVFGTLQNIGSYVVVTRGNSMGHIPVLALRLNSRVFL